MEEEKGRHKETSQSRRKRKTVQSLGVYHFLPDRIRWTRSKGPERGGGLETRVGGLGGSRGIKSKDQKRRGGKEIDGTKKKTCKPARRANGWYTLKRNTNARLGALSQGRTSRGK